MKKTIAIGLFTGMLLASGNVILAQDTSTGSRRGQEIREEKKEEREERMESICDRVETAFESRMKGYERAKEVRTKAFERTRERWEVLFDKLDERGIDTATVRADSIEVKTKFDALIAADDAMMEAMKEYAKANCAKEGVSEAKTSLAAAQKARREARTAYNASLKKLHTDLAKLRSTRTNTGGNTDTNQ